MSDPKTFPPEALTRLRAQCDHIKGLSEQLGESQGLVANALTQLIVADTMRALSARIEQLDAGIVLALTAMKKADEPRIFVPQ